MSGSEYNMSVEDDERMIYEYVLTQLNRKAVDSTEINIKNVFKKNERRGREIFRFLARKTSNGAHLIEDISLTKVLDRRDGKIYSCRFVERT